MPPAITERMPEQKYLYGASVIIGEQSRSVATRASADRSMSSVEGIMTLTSPALRDLYDLRVFVVSAERTTPRFVGHGR